jgi:hypothetical protein
VLEVAADVSGLALGEVLDAGERERARRARDVGAEPPAPVSFTGNSDAAPARDPRPSSTLRQVDRFRSSACGIGR